MAACLVVLKVDEKVSIQAVHLAVTKDILLVD
jgi:hypothetical protein